MDQTYTKDTHFGFAHVKVREFRIGPLTREAIKRNRNAEGQLENTKRPKQA